MRRPAVLWSLAAFAGIVLVAGLTLAASRLSALEVGLSSEPLQAGRALAPTPSPTPRAAKQAKPKPKPKATRTPRKRTRPRPTAAPVASATAQPVAPVPTVEDNSGHGSDDSGGDDHGSGGHGSDD